MRGRVESWDGPIITANDGQADTVNGGPDTDTCTTDGIDTVFNCE